MPAYPAFPPEMVFPRTPHTSSPAAILRATAEGGRVAYFPGDIDRTLWRSGNVDLSRLLQNTVDWLVDGRRPVKIDGNGILETFAWETSVGYALHLLNYTNPNMTRGFFRQFYPLAEQAVTFEIPSGRSVRAVRALRRDRALEFRQEGTTVRFVVPSINDYEVIALEATQ